MVLNSVKDIGDSVFIMGGERPIIPWNFVFPSFAFASYEGQNPMIWPWLKETIAAYVLYRDIKTKLGEGNSHISDEMNDSHLGYWTWEQRESRAALFATYIEIREMMFQFGRLFPDYIDINIAGVDMNGQSWHPFAPEIFMSKESDAEYERSYREDPIGYIRPLHKLQNNKQYNPGHYKYIIIPMAGEATSTSGRLLFLLAYSGSVILLPESTLQYHISARLQPWVHYVPYSFAGSDLIEKVLWLQQHDDMARQIAENGKAFGKSYLRLEDYFCYAAKALSEVSRLTKDSDAIYPSVNATKESGKKCGGSCGGIV